MPTCTSTRWLRRLALVCVGVGVLGTWAIQPLYKITIPCGTGLSRASLDTVCKVDTVFPSRAVRLERNGACRVQGRSVVAAQFSARGRGASLPTGRSTRKCAESRRGRETWSSENPSIDKLGRYRNPRWDRV